MIDIISKEQHIKEYIQQKKKKSNEIYSQKIIQARSYTKF